MNRSMIEARGLERTYRGGPRALAGVDLEVAAGTRFALLGPNGAGKSTLTRILSTLSKADAGTVRIDGIPLKGNTAGVRSRIGVALQELQLDGESSVHSQLRFQGLLYGMASTAASSRAEELMERFGLSQARDRKAKDLSGGNKRRLHVALALVHGPRLLFLDEPTTGMDPEIRSLFWAELTRLNRDEGTTIFFTTQYLEEAEKHAQELAVIDGGAMVYRGTIEDFVAAHGMDGGLEEGYLRFLAGRREKPVAPQVNAREEAINA
jgi:ABC-2 type transport system ATP-binding protein